MNSEEISKTIKNIKEFEKSISKNVIISHLEVERIAVERLIEIRNANIKREEKFIEHFDYVIRFFLTEDEFNKYVIKKKELEEYGI